MAIRPFTIDVSDEVLTDLHRRLAETRFIDDSPGRPPSGMTSAYLRELVASWRGLDWRARERWLNGHPQYLAEVDGATVHFVHLRSERDDAPALLVMHGWPHTFALQLDFADLLTDFHVVVPSFPGFAFSSPQTTAFSEEGMAQLMNRLMTEVLGYDRYLTYGEDISANINDLIAARFPESVAGVIVTHAHFPTEEERAGLADPAAHAFFAGLQETGARDGAYAFVQATRPDTLAVALNDSPAGLLAWLAEKLVEWADTPRAEPPAIERRISRTRILTEAMIYWVTRSVSTSFRPYFDRVDAVIPPVQVPAAVAIQRHEGDYPESLARTFYRDLRFFGRLAQGGHFAAAEVPQELAERTRAFARELGLLR
ncbi:MAG: epoxide hydrolase 1 [Gemmatimonadota bacterium]|nr:epoxide hydrolase 1 [Gemmatimonadota bacterium]